MIPLFRVKEDRLMGGLVKVKQSSWSCKLVIILDKCFYFNLLGRGVFTHKAIEPYSFVVEYRGNIFPHKDATPKKKWGDTLNNFLFEFSWKGAQWW